jgi:UDP-N-acetylglucosamine 2-epimerase (non-hydrolysing)
MVIYGTRPEAVKLAPVIAGLAGASALDPIVVVTAQHRTMLDQVNELFGIQPHHDLNILRDRQTLTQVTLRALEMLVPIVESERPDAVVVQGDTTTTLMGALAAFYSQVPVVHVEAGLRTHRRYSPYPEEVNRQMTTRLATLHLAPTHGNHANLLAEGIDPAEVVVTGNTVIDALLDAITRTLEYGDATLDRLDHDERRVILVTAHRRESWGRPLAAVGRALARIAAAEPETLLVLPVHLNPVVREALLPPLSGLDNVIVTEPLAYAGFAKLMRRAALILTDSGGVQEEGPSLGKPVLVMRDTTERPEAVEAGTVKLVGTDEERLVAESLRLLRDPAAYDGMANAINPYGDGHAAARSVAAIGQLLGVDDRIDDFAPGSPSAS